MKMRRRAALVLALALPCTGGAALAADYPTKPIKIVVPYAPGGGADAVARIVARKVSESTGYHIVVENKGGAGAILGTDQVAKAEPDGYTLLLGQSGPISINPAVYKTLPYDPVKDFTPITHDNGLSLRPGGQFGAAGEDAAGACSAGRATPMR